MVLARLAARIARKDSLALKLAMRPDRQELIERGILHAQTERERHMQREAVGARLTRYLNYSLPVFFPILFFFGETVVFLIARSFFFLFFPRRLSLRPTQEELEERNILKRTFDFPANHKFLFFYFFIFTATCYFACAQEQVLPRKRRSERRRRWRSSANLASDPPSKNSKPAR